VAVVSINKIFIGGRHPLVFILGPCVIESRDHCLKMAERLKTLSETQKFPFIFKSSYDKANRTSVNSFRGPGLDEGLKILQEVRTQFQVPVLTDIHEPSHAKPVAEVVDVLQIPAFLCRQTDLLIAAGQTGKPVNLKKGQFVSPFDMIYPIRKIESTGNRGILLTERGACFGYGNLVTDARSIPIMQETGYPVIFDATHSAQIPGGTITGGDRKYIPTLTKAMVAAGCDGIFMEVHDKVDEAKSDRATQFPLDELPDLLHKLIELSALVRKESLWQMNS